MFCCLQLAGSGHRLLPPKANLREVPTFDLHFLSILSTLLCFYPIQGVMYSIMPLARMYFVQMGVSTS